MAIVVGCPPPVAYCAPQKIAFGTDELAVAGGIVGSPINVVRAKTVDLLVPAESEFVIEGTIDTEYMEPEGPFGESHGHINLEEYNFIFEVTAITHRRNAVFASIISQVTPSESSVVKRVAYEPLFLEHLRDHLGIKGVRRVSMHEPLTNLRRVIVLQVATDTPRTEVWRALYGTTSFQQPCGKYVIAVNEDIDPENADAVFWAMAYRSNPERGYGDPAAPRPRPRAQGDGRGLIASDRRHAARSAAAGGAAQAGLYGARAGAVGRARPAAAQAGAAMARLFARRLVGEVGRGRGPRGRRRLARQRRTVAPEAPERRAPQRSAEGRGGRRGMSGHRIAVIAGDGIGTEVMPEGIGVVEAAARRFDIALDFTGFDWNCSTYEETGRIMPADGLDRLAEFDAIYLGAVGMPGVPDHVSLWDMLIPIRRRFNQYVNLRPARLFEGVRSPLADRRPEDIDMMIVRENVEGEYSQIGGRLYPGTEDELAIQQAVFTKRGCDRIMRFAFELASARPAKKVTSATKSNGIIHSMPYWDERFAAIAAEYPGIETDRYHIDILTAHFVAHPDWFDVVVGSNLFGDILSDLGPAVAGSHRAGRIRQHQPGEGAPLDVRAGAWLGAGHRRARHCQPDRPDLVGRDDAGASGPRRRGGGHRRSDRGAARRGRPEDRRSRRKRDHARGRRRAHLGALTRLGDGD